MQLEVPDALRGRVMGVHSITYSLMPLGGLLLGAIANETTVVTAVAVRRERISDRDGAGRRHPAGHSRNRRQSTGHALTDKRR